MKTLRQYVTLWMLLVLVLLWGQESLEPERFQVDSVNMGYDCIIGDSTVSKPPYIVLNVRSAR